MWTPLSRPWEGRRRRSTSWPESPLRHRHSSSPPKKEIILIRQSTLESDITLAKPSEKYTDEKKFGNLNTIPGELGRSKQLRYSAKTDSARTLGWRKTHSKHSKKVSLAKKVSFLKFTIQPISLNIPLSKVIAKNPNYDQIFV